MADSKVYTALKVAGGLLALSVGVEAFAAVFDRLRRRCFVNSDRVHEILFFPDDQPTCKAVYTERQGCHNPRCRFSHDEKSAFARMMIQLMSARKTLDLCVFCFTSPEFADIIIGLNQHGVTVRLITDNEQVDAMNSQVGKFRKEGIQVRTNQTSYLMHHKFAIIDGVRLINGSFNWTRQAVTGNNENVLITADPSMVTPFIAEFNKLWAKFGIR